MNRTYRELDDGERIEGAWRHAFIKNGDSYFLTALSIYADGLIDCWGLVDLDEFRRKVASGWVATAAPDGAHASAFGLGRWTLSDVELTAPADLIAEVADTIRSLQGLPDTSDLCRAALDAYLVSRSDGDLEALRAAYADVPEPQRMFLLGDQDAKDHPIRAILSGSDVQGAIAYLQERSAEDDAWRERTNDGDPDGSRAAPSPSVGSGGYGFGPPGWVDPAGDGYLSNDIPCAIALDGVTYASVTHAYWALAVADAAVAESIRVAATAADARRLGTEVGVYRADWPVRRLAVMHRLVRLKFEQHPELAARLLATGDARIAGIGLGGRYWNAGGGRNWLGRILELVRAELVDAAAGCA